MQNRFMRFSWFQVLILFLLSTPHVLAQEKRAIQIEDYGKWETPGTGVLSPNGEWLAQEVRRGDGNHELRIHNLTTGEVTESNFGARALFSDDSRYLAYRIDIHEDERRRLEEDGQPTPYDMGLFDTGSGNIETLEGVSSFLFSDDGLYLAILRYPQGGDSEASEEEGEDRAAGADLIIRDLADGTDLHFGDISEFTWQDAGDLLAMTTAVKGNTGNGIRVLDPSTGRLRVLDSGGATYSGLAWRKDAHDLAVLRSLESDDYETDTHVVLAWKDLDVSEDASITFDPTTEVGFPDDMRIVQFRQPEWADDGNAIYFGIKEWEKLEELSDGDAEEDDDADRRRATVEVWHPRDLNAIPEQKLNAKEDREKNYLSVWHLDSGGFLPLGDEDTEDVWPLGGDRFALAFDLEPYRFESMFGRGQRDVYLIDLQTGERRKIVEQQWGGSRFPDSTLSSSPDGGYLAYFKDDHYWIYNLADDTHRNLTAGLSTVFVNQEDDHTAPQKPPYGMAGWTTGDRAVVLYDRYDVWAVPTDASPPMRVTRGRDDQIRHRYVRLDPDQEAISSEEPMYLSLYGEWTKQSGFARVDPEGTARAERLVWRNKELSELIKAEHADAYAYVEEGFDDSPDYFVGGADLGDAEQVTSTNPFQQEHLWGRSELIEYENSNGDRLQGALFYPSDYEPGRTYPMVVLIYEKRSQLLHRYTPLSLRAPYNTSVFNAEGYFVLQPDIVYQAREPGASALDCIESAVEKVLETGMVDPARLGLVGHSWGGYETTFVATQTDLFQAAVAGAPLTNLFSMYGSVFWNTGIPETGHFEVGQERMEVPFWTDREAYVRNSPIFSIERLETPLLITFGDKDGSVDWHQGIEMYNAARRLGKQLVLLVYPGENHSLAIKENQIDYHDRIIEWFGSYLKGQEPVKWIAEGVSYLESEAEPAGR